MNSFLEVKGKDVSGEFGCVIKKLEGQGLTIGGGPTQQLNTFPRVRPQ